MAKSPFDRGMQLVREAGKSEAEWTEDDCKDVRALFYQNKKRNKDLSLQPMLPGRSNQQLFLSGQQQTRLQYYRDPVSKGKVTLPYLKKLYQQKCGQAQTSVATPAAPSNNKAVLTPLDEKTLRELDVREKQDAAVQEKIKKDAEAQEAAEHKMAIGGTVLVVGAVIVGYLLYLRFK